MSTTKQVKVEITAEDKTSQAFSAVQEQLSTLRSKVESVSKSMSHLGGAHSGFLSEFGRGLVYTTAFQAFEAIKGGFEDMIRGAYDSTVAWQGWQFTLESAGLTASDAANQLKFLSQTAGELGINIKDIGTQFSAFITVTEGANIPLQQADAAFKAITEVARVQHLPGQRLQRSIQMIDEMIAMGTAHMQQFRGVLRDWPALMDVLSQSAGISEGRLYELIKTGKVSSQMLVKWLENMQNVPSVATGVSGAVNSLQASMGRLGTSWFNLTNQANNPQGLQNMVNAIDSLAAALNNPSVQKGFSATISYLAELATMAIKAASAYGEYLSIVKKGVFGTLNFLTGQDKGDTPQGQIAFQIKKLQQEKASIQNIISSDVLPSSSPLAPIGLNAHQLATYKQQVAALNAQISILQMQSQWLKNQSAQPSAVNPQASLTAPELSGFTPDKSLMAVQTDGTTKYQTAVNQLSDSMKILNENASNLQKTLNTAFADKHDVEGYRDALLQVDAVIRKSPQYTAQVNSDISQMVGQSVDGIVVTSQMAQQAMTQLQQKSAQMNEYAKEAARNIQDSFSKFLMDPFKDGLKGMLRAFVHTMDEMAAQALTAKIFAPKSQGGMNVGGLLTSLFGTWLGGTSGARAEGGPVSGNHTYLVGENGPELFHPSTSGNIIPNHVLRNSSSASSPTINIDARGAGPDETAKLLSMRNDIIRTVQSSTEFRLQKGAWRVTS